MLNYIERIRSRKYPRPSIHAHQGLCPNRCHDSIG